MLIFKTSKIPVLIGILLLWVSFSIQANDKKIKLPKTDLTAAAIIPLPLEISATKGSFVLDASTIIETTQGDAAFEDLGIYLAAKIKAKTGLDLSVNKTSNAKEKKSIQIRISDHKDLEKPESYQLLIDKKSVLLNSGSAEGAFRGLQTLRQIIPEKGNDPYTDEKIRILPTGQIYDHPQFEYRGTMLDVARHFFGVEEVKRYIDLLSYYKYNVLHLHLSDDQGWRIEIKSWPKLTEIGGSSEVGGGPGGFFTQEDFKDLVDYAASHYMMIVPEIDMPGHTNAASVSYPFLNGNGKELKLYKGTKVGFSTFDTRKDSVYNFIDDVVREISAISPSPYFHIGGDESDATEKADYIYFVNRVEKIVQKHGKQMIGWDEVATADLGHTSITHFWWHKENASLAVEKGMKIILSPANKTYLDMMYNLQSKFGLNWAGYIAVDEAYNWSPEKYSGAPMEHILGIEAPLWSETISNMDELEYLAFPRVIGYAELGWTTSENRDWEHYKLRLALQAPYLERMKVKYYVSPLIDWKKE